MPPGVTSGAIGPDGRTPSTESAKSILVLVPSLHRPDLVEKCLASLAQQSLPRSQFDVLVIENEARPETVPVSLPENVRCIFLPENLGTTGSINRGLEQSRSEFVLFLNNDVQLDHKFLEVLLAALRAEPAMGFATGKLLNARRRNILDGAGDALLCGGGAYRLGHEDEDRGQFDRETPVIAGCGAATLYRRSMLDQIQGLDEDFFAYLDDVDLGLRAHLAGYTGIYTPQAVAYHLGSATLGDLFHARIAELLTRNQLLLLLKDYPSSTFWRLLGDIAFFQLLWLALVIQRGRFVPYLRGLAGAVQRMPKILAKRHHIMRFRHITSSQFLALLRASERQIFEWHAGRTENTRSRLLTAYFRLFQPR